MKKIITAAVIAVLVSPSLYGMDEPKGQKRPCEELCEQVEWGLTCPQEIVRGTILRGFFRCMEEYFKKTVSPATEQTFRQVYVQGNQIPNTSSGQFLRGYIEAWYANIHGRQRVGGPKMFKTKDNSLFFA
jgi:hypothetical protein